MSVTPRICLCLRRFGLLAQFFAVALLIAALAGSSIPSAHAQPGGGAKRFGACLASQKSGDLLLLFDESSSLQETDPQAARVQAARYLLQTLGKYADRVGANLEVASAGFSDTYTREQDWTKLTGATAGQVSEQLSTFETKNTGMDTDYWLALDGARQEFAARGQGPNGGQRCQAIAWFSDGKIDFTPRATSKPYADGVSLDSPTGVGDTTRRAVESICRPGGLADQLRSSGIIMLGIGLGANKTPSDFDVMSAISKALGLSGMACGDITDPVPGDFYPVSNIDDMLFAFDALNPDPGTTRQGPVCQLRVCPEARHNFTLDRSIKSVDILGSGGAEGVVPYLISPSGKTLELPKRDGRDTADLDGMPVTYEWQSESAQTISLHNTGGPQWPGQWAIVYVDTTGQNPDAVSRVSIHITTDIFPALANADEVSWRSGQVVEGLTFGLVDGQGNPMQPTDLAGTATMSAALAPDGAAPIPLLESVAKPDIATPVDADLTDMNPGRALLRMSLVITTAPATDPSGAQIAPGTQLSPQDVEVPVQILPKLGLPVPGERIDFGTVQATKGATASLNITGPGCAWIADTDAAKVVAAPDDIGTPRLSSAANSAQNCVKVQAGQTGQLPVTLRTERDGQGGLNGTVPVHVAALDNPGDSQVAEVPFVASLIKPLNTTNFVLVFLAALLLGPGIPLALLYAAKWWVSKIPDTPMLADRIPVEVSNDVVLRDGDRFALADTDLIRPVPGLAGGARKVSVQGVTLTTTVGRSPFGAGYVLVDADGLVSAGSELPATDAGGLRAVLPLAVHNKWVVLHDPRGPADVAEVLLLVGGRTDTAARERLYEDVGRRLPELLSGLRLRAVEAGMAISDDQAGQQVSPFGEPTQGASAAHDPFQSTGPVRRGPPRPAGPPRPGLGGSADAGPQGGGAPPPRPTRHDPDPFDPFGEGN
jgi:hypothetical protein